MFFYRDPLKKAALAEEALTAVANGERRTANGERGRRKGKRRKEIELEVEEEVEKEARKKRRASFLLLLRRLCFSLSTLQSKPLSRPPQFASFLACFHAPNHSCLYKHSASTFWSKKNSQCAFF